MAIVHGDGGHYREAHGDRKAADDAIAIVIDLRAELAAKRGRREAAEALLSWLDQWTAAHFARYKRG